MFMLLFCKKKKIPICASLNVFLYIVLYCRWWNHGRTPALTLTYESKRWSWRRSAQSRSEISESLWRWPVTWPELTNSGEIAECGADWGNPKLKGIHGKDADVSFDSGYLSALWGSRLPAAPAWLRPQTSWTASARPDQNPAHGTPAGGPAGQTPERPPACSQSSDRTQTHTIIMLPWHYWLISLSLINDSMAGVSESRFISWINAAFIYFNLSSLLFHNILFKLKHRFVLRLFFKVQTHFSL